MQIRKTSWPKRAQQNFSNLRQILCDLDLPNGRLPYPRISMLLISRPSAVKSKILRMTANEIASPSEVIRILVNFWLKLISGYKFKKRN